MPHLDDRQIDEYSTGVLPEPLLAQAEEHLLACTECQQRLVQTDEFVALFREAVQEQAPARAGWRSWSPFGRTAAWVGAAAVVALAVVIPLQVREGPTATIMLQSLRGPESTVQTSSRTPLRLVFDVPAADAGRVQIVDLAGKQVAETAAESASGSAVAKVEGLPRGSYWVRLYAKSNPAELLSEYALKAK
jgi:hypothetical protein